MQDSSAGELLRIDPADLIPYTNNAKIHDDANVLLIAGSIRQFGFRNPVLIDGENGIIAGHGRVLAALKLGLDTVPCVDCSDMSEAQRRAYIIADNKIAEQSPWNEELLALELKELGKLDADLAGIGFDETELNALISGEGGQGGNPYTQKVESPVYEPSGKKHPVPDLFDAARTSELLAEIDEAGLPDDVADFLRHAAARHTVFRYAKIADFYAQSDEQIQRLMERSALVVIDYDQAIQEGFVKLTETVDAEYEASNDEA